MNIYNCYVILTETQHLDRIFNDGYHDTTSILSSFHTLFGRREIDAYYIFNYQDSPYFIVNTSNIEELPFNASGSGHRSNHRDGELPIMIASIAASVIAVGVIIGLIIFCIIKKKKKSDAESDVQDP